MTNAWCSLLPCSLGEREATSLSHEPLANVLVLSKRYSLYVSPGLPRRLPTTRPLPHEIVHRREVPGSECDVGGVVCPEAATGVWSFERMFGVRGANPHLRQMSRNPSPTTQFRDTQTHSSELQPLHLGTMDRLMPQIPTTWVLPVKLYQYRRASAGGGRAHMHAALFPPITATATLARATWRATDG